VSRDNKNTGEPGRQEGTAVSPLA